MLLGIDPCDTTREIPTWFVQCWQLAVTFDEVRRHLDVGMQRQSCDLALRRTTPALLGLFSLVTLLAHRHMAKAGSVR